MAQFKTLQFPNTPRGQAEKVRRLQVESMQGWRVVSETIVPGKFNGGKACCLFLIFAPCAFLAGHKDDVINVTLTNDLTLQPQSSASSFDRKKWNALVQYDGEVAIAAGKIRALGEGWVDELAAAYLTLNDNKYLPEITSKIEERAQVKRVESEARLAREEAGRQAAAQEKERIEQERRERYQRWRNNLWGTKQRQLWTITILGLLLLFVLLGILLIGHGSSSAVTRIQTVSMKQSKLDQPVALIRPSFDCTKVRSEVLKMVCATPELAVEDQRLATAYASAIANSASPDTLRRSERFWILQRNRSAADINVLSASYEKRISFLESVAGQAP